MEKIRNLPINLVLVHDETNILSRREIEEIASLLPSEQVVLIQGFYGSPGVARNVGLELVETEWVVFWDSDDAGEPENLIKVIELNLKFSVIICAYTKNSDFDPNYCQLITINSSKNIFLQMAKQGGLWRCVIKKELIGDVRFSNTMMGEDQRFLIDLDLEESELVTTDVILYNYYFGSSSHLTSNKKYRGEVQKTLNEIIAKTKENKDKLNLYESAVCIRLFLSVCKHSSIPTKWSVTIKFLYMTIFRRKISTTNLVLIVVDIIKNMKGKSFESK